MSLRYSRHRKSVIELVGDVRQLFVCHLIRNRIFIDSTQQRKITINLNLLSGVPLAESKCQNFRDGRHGPPAEN